MISYYDVLKASKGAGTSTNYYAALMAQTLRSTDIAKLEGVPPLAFNSNGSALIDWRISGANGGVGDKSTNNFNCKGSYTPGPYNNVYIISGLDTTKQYTCSTSLERISGAQAACIYFSQSTSISSGTNGVWKNEAKTFSPNENGELFIHVRNTAASGAPAIADDVIAGEIEIMVNEGSSPLPFEQYGYKLSITCGGDTNTLYLDAPLAAGDTISMADTGITIPTVEGSNTLNVTSTVQPSSVYIKYHK